MEHIHNYLTLSVEAESPKEIELANWLRQAHYVYAIDHERNAILIFNCSQWLKNHLVQRFGISDWAFDNNPNPPRHYVKLFRYVDWHLFENIGIYRWFAQKHDYDVFSTYSERYTILDASYYRGGYSAWRLRFYLSRGLMGMDARNPRHCYYYDDNNEDLALIRKLLIPPLVEAQKKLEVPSTFKYPIDLEIWLNQDLLFIGWFVNDLYVYSFRGLFEKLSIITKEMMSWMHENGYPRNTFKPCVIADFLDRLRQNNLKE